MTIAKEVIDFLRTNKRIQIAMPETDGLKEGRELFNRIQGSCSFPLCYVQRLGCDPILMIWKFESHSRAMEGYEVERYAC